VDLAPDLVEPVVAWRVWRALDDGGVTRLSSIFYRSNWPHCAPLVASCQHVRLPLWPFRREWHEAPAARCGCGIYATSAARLRAYLRGRLTLIEGISVVGRVSLWGTVVECESGWRASLAYPEELYVPIFGIESARAARIVDDLRRYRVPVREIHKSRVSAVMDEVCAPTAA
jgi:hypothetical protein